MASYYSRHTPALKKQLREHLGTETLRRLHRRQPYRHFLIVFRQLALLAGATYGLVRFPQPYVWVPLALVQGFTVFNFTVLLHEVVHNTVFASNQTSRRWNRILGYLYAVPSGISSSQFTRWHLDHHAQLGSPTDDPKRFHLSPKRNRRWLKLLYFTPALFYLYFRAAARETATYPEPYRRAIGRERRVTLLFHGAVAVLCGMAGGWGVLMRVYLIPVFFVFPVAFGLNRLGQHYNIKPEDPAQWSTLVKSSPWWNFWFLYSNLHLEHHYFPGVPFYRLKELHRLLQPFYRERGMKAYGYAELFYRYIILNAPPHADWERVEIEVPVAGAA